MRRAPFYFFAAVAVAAIFTVVGVATAAQSHTARLTVTPDGTTSDTKAVFRWTTGRGVARTFCRLRWRPLQGQPAALRSRVAPRFRRCHRSTTWKHLRPGRYTFTLVVHRRRGWSHWLGYSWRVVPASAGPPPTTTTTTTTTTPPPPPPPPPPTPTPPPSSTDCVQSPYHYLWPVFPSVSSQEQQFVDLVNEARQGLGLQPLALNSSLSLAADSHSYWQDVAFGYSGLTHEPGCNGSSPWQRIADAGFTSAGYEGEVTLVRYPAASAQQAFTMFKNSPEHWQLLTSPLFTQIGVGESTYHWTGDLGGP